MSFLKIGIRLFVVSTLLGILGMVVFLGFQDLLDFIYRLNPYAQGLIILSNLTVWIISVILIIIGLKKRGKNKKEAKDKEFQELKDKVEKLEKEKKEDLKD